ncbi:MAG: matrixin family metalloprotease [Planctomycetota bacterium]|nr:matrixin family metalloprotease [Planctomycetota bacterium]
MSRLSAWNQLLAIQVVILACAAASLAAERSVKRKRHRERATAPAADRTQKDQKKKQAASGAQKDQKKKQAGSGAQKNKKKKQAASGAQKNKKKKQAASGAQKNKKKKQAASGAQKNKKKRQAASGPRTRNRAKSQTTESDHQAPQNEPILPPSIAYKNAASHEEVALDFADTGFQWPQPNGLGSAVTITYSFSNLLDGELRGLSAENAKRAVEEALTLWSEVAPIHFVELVDEGPLPTGEELAYLASDYPQIRFGHHLIDGETGAALAHAYLPFSTREGLAGDIHFDRDEPWNRNGGGLFLETALHEIGHALGLDHDVENDAIMNPIIQNRFDDLGTGYLLEDDITGIRNLYGYGTGSVVTLDAPVNTPPSEDPHGDNNDQDPQSDQEAFGVLATLDTTNRTLSISGDHGANSIVVISVPWFVAVIGTEDTPVNSQPGALFLLSPRGSITCNLGAGDDTLTCFRLRTRTLECELGAGDDTISLLFCSIRNVLANGATGTDALFRLGSQIKNLGHVGFEQVK